MGSNHLEYLVFQSGRGMFTVNLKGAEGTFAVEWVNINADAAVPGKALQGGGVAPSSRLFPAPRRSTWSSRAADSDDKPAASLLAQAPGPVSSRLSRKNTRLVIKVREASKIPSM